VKNIYTLIEHFVNNWQNNLFEALAPRVKQQLIDKFKQEADDYDIEVTDKQLSDYIDFFDSKLK
jgi:dihydroneopterin aldolase